MNKGVKRNSKTIYFDNAATTPVDPRVFEAMKPYLGKEYGNPSSIYSLGRSAKQAVSEARGRVAKVLNADPEEIYFTGSGTEADNWALKGIAFANRSRGRHIITTQIEHHAVLHAAEFLEGQGFKVTYLPVDKKGFIKIGDFKKSIRKDTILASVMFANNEIGTLEPVSEIGKICRQKGIYFHTDAVQAIGHASVDVKKMNIDLLSLSGHKFNGPKGVGSLYIRKGVRIEPFIHGGGQERRMRAGTENTAGIVGLGKAIELAARDMERKIKRVRSLRNAALRGILEAIPDVIVNGDLNKRLPGNLNVSFKYVEGESILLMLDKLGVAASTGSACTSGSLEPSHVLLALGLGHADSHGSLRLSFGEQNTRKEVIYLLKVLPGIIEKLRKMSPLRENKGRR
ncbi:MAG: cysteine desulfurase NifS [Patescibacteria group bacterium]|nr:cysteine desulfurase NifS [Patescibacteria group bacterium]